MKKYAILGGGISGLSCAFYLKKLLPNSHVTVFDSSKRFGGWIETKTHHNQLFETGPRTLRPTGVAGANTLAMVHELALDSQVIAIPRNHPAAQNRFILFNDKIQKIPMNPLEIIFKPPPFMKGFAWKILKEPFIRPATHLTDESVYDFVSRRLGQDVAENLVSAIIHGIYAGDSKQLSVKSTLKMLWEAEKNHGSIVKSNFAPPSKPKYTIKDITVDSSCIEFINKIQSNSVYTFDQGVGQLVTALTDHLQNTPGVSLESETQVTGLEFHNNQVSVATSSPSSSNKSNKVSANKEDQDVYDWCFSTIPAYQLAGIHGISNRVSSVLLDIPYVDVAVINLAYDMSNIEFKDLGFGYLVPMSCKSMILGTVFDSFTVSKHDSDNLTRFTVMIRPSKEQWSEDSKEFYLDQAVSAVAKYLNIPASHLREHFVSLHSKCIPQYTVGHSERLLELQKQTEHIPLSLVGSSFNGVSVNDCIWDAKVAVDKCALDFKLEQKQTQNKHGIKPFIKLESN